MVQKQETPNLLKIFTWKEFKLLLNETFMPHHLVLKDGMEFLEIIQGDGMGSFAHYVQDFNTKLIIVPFKEFARKLAFLRGLKPWLQKIVYYKVNILDTCQGFMKMVECMEDKGHPCY
jgi:hypothetical protein